MDVRIVDELPFAFGWIAPEPRFMLRASHALAVDGRVWLLDPVDAPELEERVRALGEPAGVVQLLDRHPRGCRAWAERLGVPVHVVPAELPGSGLRVLRVVSVPGWREVALYEPVTRTLATADALASAPGYADGRGPLSVHPFLRLFPPRALGELDVQHVLCGHGAGVHGLEAHEAVASALRTARSGLPGYVATQARRVLARRRALGR
jgi:hypothetical protein